MKLSLAIVSIIFAASLNAPAFAQDWDMQPSDTVAPVVTHEYRSPSPLEHREAEPSIGWDMKALAAGSLGNTTYATGSVDNGPHTTGNTGNQSVPNLPLCRTHTLSIVSGPVAANGLPPCSLDSFVKNAGGNAFNIYGDEGSNGKPPLEDFQSINSGISGDWAAGLTTGQAQ
jgi:hypothetical protein